MNDIELKVELARMDERIKALQRELVARDLAQERTLEATAADIQRGVQKVYLERETHSVVHRDLDDALADIGKSVANFEGRAWMLALVVTISSTVLSVMLVEFLKKGGP